MIKSKLEELSSYSTNSGERRKEAKEGRKEGKRE